MDRVQNTEPTTMEPGNYVVMRKLNGSKMALARLRRNATINVDNLTFRADPCFGKSFGVYLCQNGLLGPEMADVQQELDKIRSISQPDSSDTPGDQVALVKEKVQLKKAKKAQCAILVEKVNTRLLAEFYYQRSPETVGYLRPDLAAQCLHNSGVKQSDRVLVYDQCYGVLTTYVVERLGGVGACVVLHNGPSPSGITCFHTRQFPENVRKSLVTLPLKMLLARNDPNLQADENSEQINAEEKSTADLDEEAKRKLAESMARAAEKRARQQEALDWFGSDLPQFGRYDALLIVTKTVTPVSVLKLVFNGLRTAGNVVIYSPYQQHIANAKAWLDSHHCVFNEIRSTQCRELQVLPKRTHPLMQQLVIGGYFMSAIRGYHP